MRINFIISLLFFANAANAQLFLQKNERLVFSFDTKQGNHLSLARDSANAYLVYRFGTIDSIQFEYPARNQNSWKKFTYVYYLRGGGVQNEGMDLNYLRFKNNGFEYEIFDCYYAVGNKSEIGINITNLKTGKKTVIQGVKATRKGTMVDFRDNTLVEQAELDQ